MYSVVLKKQYLSGFIIHTSSSITCIPSLCQDVTWSLCLWQGLYLVPLTSKIMSDCDTSFTAPVSFLVAN